jgi:hypothetical protein
MMATKIHLTVCLFVIILTMLISTLDGFSRKNDNHFGRNKGGRRWGLYDSSSDETESESTDESSDSEVTDESFDSEVTDESSDSEQKHDWRGRPGYHSPWGPRYPSFYRFREWYKKWREDNRNKTTVARTMMTTTTSKTVVRPL